VKRKPRSLFKARQIRPGVGYVGPEFAGPEPNYIAKQMEFIRQHPELIQPGKLVNFAIAHDDWCSLFDGGPCDCDPDISVMETPR
jgi:hypothetical protein